mmetsp:Transcript_58391/g.81016  ORF Transcript_58391/g.81016 Transcript_58391/m.81016 type:complete len:94 (+) Transcript_58391:742-1023(+)
MKKAGSDIEETLKKTERINDALMGLLGVGTKKVNTTEMNATPVPINNNMPTQINTNTTYSFPKNLSHLNQLMSFGGAAPTFNNGAQNAFTMMN